MPQTFEEEWLGYINSLLKNNRVSAKFSPSLEMPN